MEFLITLAVILFACALAVVCFLFLMAQEVKHLLRKEHK